MKPLKLFITAFGPYAATEVVDFRRAVDAGLFGIYGPTGSGKSSIFSAMAFALFGEGARHEQPTTSMRSGHAAAQTLTEVSFLFELGGKRYFVRRQPEQKRPRMRGDGETDHVHTAYLFDVTDIEIDDVSVDNCGTVLAEKRVGVVNERIRDLLGYDVEQFRQIVLLPQGQFERFLASDSKARLEILRGLFDVSLYERMTERLKERAAEARTTYQQGMSLHVQQLTNAGFASTDDLTSAIDAAEGRCAELDVGAATADATRAAAAATLGNGEALQKCFDEAGAAATALAALQGRQTDMDALRERHTAAGCATQLVDRDDAVTRAVTALAAAKDTETIASRRVIEPSSPWRRPLPWRATILRRGCRISMPTKGEADMSLKRIILVAAAPVAIVAFTSPAAAQGIPVFDTSTYVQALAQVQNTIKMIQQGEQQIQTATTTLSSLQKLTNVNALAPQLLNAQVRNILPNTTIDASTLLSGDLSKIGSLGSLASSIQSRYALPATSSSDADLAYNQALKDATSSSAATAALGENTLSIAQTRMQGLDQLREQLSSAKDPKDVMDLQARISVEQAQLQNDMLKMQAIQMAQAGQANMQISAAQVAAGRDEAAFFSANTIRK